MKKSARIGSYIAEKESSHLKVSHENGTFNFRLKGGIEIDQFFDEIKNEDSKKYFDIGFSSVNIFTILMMQNPLYLESWIKWHNDYFEKLKSPEITDKKNEEICKEEEALYDMRKEASSVEITKEESECPTSSENI